MEIHDLLKQLLEQLHGAEVIEVHTDACGHSGKGYEDWNQVAKLKDEDILKWKLYLSDLSKFVQEMKLLESKMRVVDANGAATKTQFWTDIRRKYSLPDGMLHITDDARVLMKPEGRKR